MDGQQIQVSDEEPKVLREEPRRRRRKKAITSSSCTSMDHVTVEFVLPTAARGGNGPDTLLLEVAGNWTVEQVIYWFILNTGGDTGCKDGPHFILLSRR